MTDSLRKASLASFLSSGATLVTGTATNILLARALGPSLKGTYAIFLNTQGLILVPAFAMQTALTWYIANKQPHWSWLRRSLYWLIGIQALASIGIVFVLIQFGAVRAFLFAGLSTSYLVGLFLIVLCSLWGYYFSALLPGLQRYAKYSLWATVTSIMTGFTVLVLLAAARWTNHGITVADLVALSVLNSALTAGVWTVVTSRLDTFEGRLYETYTSIRDIGGFATPVLLRNIVEWMNYRVDVYFVNAFVGVREVGLYTVGTGLAQQLWIVPFAIAGPLFSKVSADGATQDSRELTQYAFKVTLVISAAIGVSFAVIAPFLIPAVYGTRFEDATPMLLLLLPGVVVIGPSRTLSAYLAGSSRPSEPLRAELVGLCATVSLDLLLIPRFGGMGAACASSVAYSLYTVVLCWRFVTLSGSTWRALLLWKRSDSKRLWALVSAVRSQL